MTAFHEAQMKENEGRVDEIADHQEDDDTHENRRRAASKKPYDDRDTQLLSLGEPTREPVDFKSQRTLLPRATQINTRSSPGKNTQGASRQEHIRWPVPTGPRILTSPGTRDNFFRQPTSQNPASSQDGPNSGFGGNYGYGGPSRVNTPTRVHNRPPSHMKTGLGQSRDSGSGPDLHAFRPKAPEFQPSGANLRLNTNGFESAKSIDQFANTSSGQLQTLEPAHTSYPRSQGAPQTMYSHQAYYDGLNHGAFAYGVPKRPPFPPSQYDNRTVAHHPQPIALPGPMYGGLDDDLSRFEAAFRELFSISRGFIGTWISGNAEINRQGPIMQYLPKVYTGFTEQQAWSYIRQHLNDGLSRSCLFARVLVDFIVQRILVLSAWQGFDFQTDRRIQQLEEEAARGPSE